MQTILPPFQDPRVRAVFEAYPPEARRRLLALRALVLEVAAELQDVGPLEESLRWGEPAYLTTVSRSGTTLRMHAKEPDSYALFVSCQTDLIATFRARHGDALRYEGKRALRFLVAEEPPMEVLRDCVALTLTYRLRKAAERRQRAKAR
ncbi:MAG: DUF1801 domain-containing protein [Alphaproteobacteria bacterium]|nr:DUF1801 domain-containing protein [Alphaproteobacteria bacterium]MCB9797479.1 DUF1801 domain-containing protein [Alphaproteobacteria bacterium]